jgi:hypothetical protein
VFFAKDAGLFLVQDGCKIRINPATGASDQLIRFYLVGRVMSILLYQRKLLVLHASVVAIDGKAVAFLGISGQGKSSLAAALYARGHGIVTDDVAPIISDRGLASIAPGFPQLKVSREVAAVVGFDANSLTSLHPDEARQGYRSSHKFPQAAIPLGCVYLLAKAPELFIERLSFQQAAIELMRHSRNALSRSSLGADNFYRCSALAKICTIYRLDLPRSLELLPAVAQFVEEHFCRHHEREN